MQLSHLGHMVQRCAVKHLWDGQNCVALAEIDINRVCHKGSLTRSGKKF